MPTTFFFYDIETSGLSHGQQRVVQFAGQRTDENLDPIGDPVNVIVALHEDVLPDPASVRVNGKAPHDLTHGISEPAFCRLLLDTVFTPGTVAAGFNNIRFDDNFIRHLLWRNFHPPYEWTYRQGRGRFDVYNLALTFRALRPDGIAWPVRDDGEPSNMLGDLCAKNNLQHEFRHDALDDVLATIALARLLRASNPQLFAYFLAMRERKALETFVSSGKPFLFVHQSFGPERHNAALVAPIYKTARGEMMVYDLSEPPEEFVGLSPENLACSLFGSKDDREAAGVRRMPVKRLTYNRNPGVAPAAVATSQASAGQAVRERLGIDIAACKRHIALFFTDTGREFFARVKQAFDEREPFAAGDVESSLYDGTFPTRADEASIRQVAACPPDDLAGCNPDFEDVRYAELLFRYKARNAPDTLSDAEQERWQEHLSRRLSPSEQWLADWQGEYDAALAAGNSVLRGKLDQLRARAGSLEVLCA